MGMPITNFCKLFYSGVKRDHYEKLIGIIELLERLALDCFNNTFSTDTRNTAKNIPLLRVQRWKEIFWFSGTDFSSYFSRSTEVSTISDITLNSSSSSDYTLVASTIGSQHTSD